MNYNAAGSTHLQSWPIATSACAVVTRVRRGGGGTGLGHENHQTIDLTHSAPALPSLSSLSCLPPPRVVTVHTLSANLRSKCLSFTNKVMNNKRKGFLGTISLYLWHLKTVNGPCNSYWDQFNALAASQRRRFENTCSTCLANIYAWSGQSWESKVIKPCHYHYHQTDTPVLKHKSNNKQALRNSCELLRQRKELHINSWNCMQAHVTACKLM